ncbi:MAG: His/Gly/Thr/Pro-type tRNA ligase C-terminal domain-containing protein, partial [Candidatus Liptonbacteria bacterium]|nr:His/Gly/Thr/Pro-type tRNA ligase C-terminal domain-containing protein [Candidatus Liptonbacteria bacterium]
VFEFFVDGDGINLGAVAGGGRYDYLLELLGGRPTPGVGGALGMERLIEAMKLQGASVPARLPRKVFIVHVGEMAKKKSLSIIEALRKANISTTEALSRESLKAQLKMADREGSRLALILGQREIFEGSIIIRDLRNSLQENVPLSRMVEEIKKRLK